MYWTKPLVKHLVEKQPPGVIMLIDVGSSYRWPVCLCEVAVIFQTQTWFSLHRQKIHILYVLYNVYQYDHNSACFQTVKNQLPFKFLSSIAKQFVCIFFQFAKFCEHNFVNFSLKHTPCTCIYKINCLVSGIHDENHGPKILPSLFDLHIHLICKNAKIKYFTMVTFQPFIHVCS